MNEHTQQVYNRTRRIIALERLANNLDGLLSQVRENYVEVAVHFEADELDRLEVLIGKYARCVRTHRDEMLDSLESDFPG